MAALRNQSIQLVEEEILCDTDFKELVVGQIGGLNLVGEFRALMSGETG
jgi:hypothetical protein